MIVVVSRLYVAVVAVVLASLLAGCGASSSGTTVVRVGGLAIDSHAVARWSVAIAHGASPAISSGSQHQPSRQRALRFLISSNWLLAEARERGLRLSDSDLKRRLREQGEATIGGQAEFQATLAATKETMADASFETQAQWAASELRRLFAERAANMARAVVTAARVASFYQAHIARYRVPELREFDLAEGFKSVAETNAFVGRGIGPSSPLAKLAFHETYPRSNHFTAPPEKRRLLEAIFAAKVGVASPPMPLDGHYVAFVIRHIRPGYLKPLASVRAAIEDQLLAKSRHQAYEELLREYVHRWAARTDCLAGYIVQQCSQYRGPLVPEDLTYLAASQP